MKNEFITLKCFDVWNDCLSRFPSKKVEIFFTPEYFAAHESLEEEGTAKCFIFEKEGDVGMYPFLMRKVHEDGYYDIEGAYGYNGVLVTTHKPSFVKEFQKAFLAFCHESRVIAEFIRFHPLLKNETFFEYMNVTKKNDNIIVNLDLSEKEIWENSYDYAVRKSIKKALKNGLKTEFFDGQSVLKGNYLDAFFEIFYKTLDRNKANSSSYYNRAFLEKWLVAMPTKLLFFFALLNDRPVSTELILLSPETGYSFLGGTLEEAFPFRPNHLLKHELILQLKRMGKRHYCIGGGQAINDDLFRYKKTFDVNGVYPFFIGTKVHNKNIYNELCDEWEKKNPEKIEMFGKYFLKYKY